VRPLSLSRFVVCVALIACGSSGGFILDDARDAAFLSLVVYFDFGLSGGISSFLTFGCNRMSPRLLIELTGVLSLLADLPAVRAGTSFPILPQCPLSVISMRVDPDLQRTEI